jgi:murein DD-endopeptidase MepM/ murein hydrolase activator NlpD
MGAGKLRIVLCVLFVVIVALVWTAIRYRGTPVVPGLDVPPTLPNTPVAIGTPISTDPVAPAAEEAPAASAPAPTVSNFVGSVHLIIPVAGIKPDQLVDTFDDARSEGRLHDAIDIMAPSGTPVLAAADGRILKLFQSERGGTTIYQLGPNQQFIFYYAHLAGYAPSV